MSSALPSPLSRLGFRPPPRVTGGPVASAASLRPPAVLKSLQSPACRLPRRRLDRRPPLHPAAAMDENTSVITILLEESNWSNGALSPKELEHSDSDSLVYPNSDVDLPPVSLDDVPSHVFAPPKPMSRRRRIQPGVLINVGLIAFLAMFLLFIDWSSWQIVRLPLQPFYLTSPFSISVVLSACAGCLYVPIVDNMKIHQVLRKEGPRTHFCKKGTPTMGGLFFIPIGVFVARQIAGCDSAQVYGAALVTLAFAAIGLLDDLLSCIKSHNYGLPGWIKLTLQAAVGACFSLWLASSHFSTPYNMKLLVPLPPPFGLLNLGRFYSILTAFCFAAMGNGVNLTDGLDGLAGGVAALAFIGMSVAVLAVCPELAVFGSSMAGACIGFLFHNRYKASIFMGDTGSLALGGALAAMAACTGMFFPLFISSGIFVMEVLSVIVQVLFMRITKRIYGVRRRFFRMAPVHHHFELCGFKEPLIVISAYAVSLILALVAGYIGLISA